MKTGANTWGHSDKKMVCPALPTDSCDSWIEAWGEEFSHLQLSPVSPAWAAYCSLQRWWQLLAKIKKIDVFCSSLASRTGCTHKSAVILLHAQEQGIGCQSLLVLTPKQYFPAPPATIRRLRTTCPLLSHTAHVSHTDVWTQTPAHFISITDQPKRYL